MIYPNTSIEIEFPIFQKEQIKTMARDMIIPFIGLETCTIYLSKLFLCRNSRQLLQLRHKKAIYIVFVGIKSSSPVHIRGEVLSLEATTNIKKRNIRVS